MQEEQPTIPQMVDDVRAGKMPRRILIKTLAAMGISAAGVGAIAAVAESPSISASFHQVQAHENQTRHIDLHKQHI